MKQESGLLNRRVYTAIEMLDHHSFQKKKKKLGAGEKEGEDATIRKEDHW